jgi:hypothetical protein
MIAQITMLYPDMQRFIAENTVVPANFFRSSHRGAELGTKI